MTPAPGDVPWSVLAGGHGHYRYARLVAARVSDGLAVPFWASGAASGRAEHVGDGGGEVTDVYRAGGVGHDDRGEPGGARWFAP